MTGAVLDGPALHARAVVVDGGNVEQTGLGTERLRPPVPGSPHGGAELDAFADAGHPRGIVRRPAADGIQTGEHVLMHEGLRLQEPHASAAAIEQPEVPIPPRMHEALDGSTASFEVYEEGSVGLVPVPRAVPVILIVTLQFAGVGVECKGRVGVEVVAGACVPEPGASVAHSPIGEVERRIVVTGHPDRSTAGAPRLARPCRASGLARGWNRVPFPDLVAGPRIERRYEPADAVFATGSADDDLAVHRQRRQGDVVGAPVVGDAPVPDHLARRRLQGHHTGVERADVDHFVVQGDAAVGRMGTPHVGRQGMHVAPSQGARRRLQGHHLLRARHEHRVAVDDGRPLRLPVVRMGAERPRRRQIRDVRCIDPIQGAESPAVVGPPIHQPTFRFGLAQPFVAHRRVVEDTHLRPRELLTGNHPRRHWEETTGQAADDGESLDSAEGSRSTAVGGRRPHRRRRVVYGHMALEHRDPARRPGPWLPFRNRKTPCGDPHPGAERTVSCVSGTAHLAVRASRRSPASQRSGSRPGADRPASAPSVSRSDPPCDRPRR